MASRQKLLAAAARIYGESGFRGATTRRIADEAGVNEVTLFRLFGSKSALIAEALREHAPRATEPGGLPNEPVDPARTTILFAGESVMLGEGLNWDETIPAQVGALMEVQSANLAVHGYATDKSYLRVESELPRFQRPVALVTLFMTALLGRNLVDQAPQGRGLAGTGATGDDHVLA